MKRRSYLSGLVVSTAALAGCSELSTSSSEEVIEEGDFNAPSRSDVEIEGGETLRVEINPRNPINQIIAVVAPESVETEGLEALSELTVIREKTAIEVTPEEPEVYLVGIGWADADDEELEETQYSLRIVKR